MTNLNLRALSYIDHRVRFLRLFHLLLADHSDKWTETPESADLLRRAATEVTQDPLFAQDTALLHLASWALVVADWYNTDKRLSEGRALSLQHRVFEYAAKHYGVTDSMELYE